MADPLLPIFFKARLQTPVQTSSLTADDNNLTSFPLGALYTLQWHASHSITLASQPDVACRAHTRLAFSAYQPFAASVLAGEDAGLAGLHETLAAHV